MKRLALLALITVALAASCADSKDDDWLERQLATPTARAVSPASPNRPPSFVVYGNPDSKIYHHPPDHPNAQRPCQLLNRSKAVRFNSPQEARAAGYRACQTRGCNLP